MSLLQRRRKRRRPTLFSLQGVILFIVVVTAKCSGSLKKVHLSCLRKWIDQNRRDDVLKCEICHADYRVVVKEKFNRREALRAKNICGSYCSLAIMQLIFSVLAIAVILSLFSKLMFEREEGERN
jgi:hypothetical protein